MQIKVEKPKRLTDGAHTGKIIDVEERNKPYEYVDLIIETTEMPIPIRVGYPKILTSESKLGMLMKRFGCNLKEGETIDINKFLVGKECTFVNINEATNKGTFPKIATESVKPAITEEKI
jgi:hypothetical protein